MELLKKNWGFLFARNFVQYRVRFIKLIMASRRVTTTSNVDWQVDKKCNADRAKYMFETSLYCDCEFLVGNEDEKEVICKL